MASKFTRNVTDIDKDKVPEYPESMVSLLDLLSDKNDRPKIYIYRGGKEFYELTDAVKEVNGNTVDENNSVEVKWGDIPEKPFEYISGDDFYVADGFLHYVKHAIFWGDVQQKPFSNLNANDFIVTQPGDRLSLKNPSGTWGSLEGKPFETLGDNLSVSENRVLSSSDDSKFIKQRLTSTMDIPVNSYIPLNDFVPKKDGYTPIFISATGYEGATNTVPIVIQCSQKSTLGDHAFNYRVYNIGTQTIQKADILIYTIYRYVESKYLTTN